MPIAMPTDFGRLGTQVESLPRQTREPDVFGNEAQSLKS